MFTDFILNGQVNGGVGEQIANCQFDPGLLRPYRDATGQKCATLNTGRKETRKDERGRIITNKDGVPIYFPVLKKYLVSDLIQRGVSSPVFNATTLRKDEWILLDSVVLKAARQRLRAWADLSAANTYGGFNGMSRTILEHETMSDPGEAVVDMDGLTDGRNDAPRFQLEGLPLPITHVDFFFSMRKLMMSRNTGTPLDTVMAEAAGRRVAETIEQTLIGTVTGMTYGDSTGYGRTSSVYGYTNFPGRVTKTDLTTPTGSNPEAVMQDVLEMRDLAYGQNFYGPYVLYHSTSYDQWLDNDYFRTGSTAIHRTLRERIQAIDGISAVRRLDYLTSGYQLLLVQMTSDVARAVNGMDITTVQWESQGGMRVNFKVMAIQVPQIREDFNGNCGIVHGTTA